MIISIIATGTRSLIIGAMLLVFLYPIKNYLVIKSRWFLIGFTFAIIGITIPIVLFIKYGLFQSSPLGREISDDYRAQQVHGIAEKIFSHPLLGTGFGGFTDLISNDNAPYSYELSIFALMMKLGLIGIIFLGFIFYKFLSHGYASNMGEMSDERKCILVYICIGYCLYGQYKSIFIFIFGVLFSLSFFLLRL